MGYTNYWYRPRVLDLPTFQAAVADCVKMRAHLAVPIVDGHGTPGTEATFSSDEVTFNGPGEQGHETFMIERDFQPEFRQEQPDGFLFDFCKTARKPYDVVCQCCLIVFKHHFGDNFRVASDGATDNEWVRAKGACQRILGYGADFKLPGRSAEAS